MAVAAMQLRPRFAACGRANVVVRGVCNARRLTGPCVAPRRRSALLVVAAADDPSGPLEPQGPQEVSLVRRFPGAGYTFLLAGALKIMTVGWIATGAPRECVRTVAGQYAAFLLLPVGLLLAFAAKKIVDAGLHENGRFMAFMMGAAVLTYFGLYGVLYRYEPQTWQAQQRLLAAATHTRPTAYAEDGAAANRRKFIIQRQLEGEYDNRLPSYYTRAPEMQMADVEQRLGALPSGMVAASVPSRSGAAVVAGSEEGSAAVGSSVAERRVGGARAAALGRAGRQRGGSGAVPSLYERTSAMPGLDESEF